MPFSQVNGAALGRRLERAVIRKVPARNGDRLGECRDLHRGFDVLQCVDMRRKDVP